MSEARQAAQGKWPGILSALGVPDSFLQNRHGPCPFCGGKDRFRFDDKEGKGTYYCNQCGSGDGFDLLMNFAGMDFKTAAQEVERIAGICKPVERKTERDPAIRLRKIRDNAKKLTGKDPVSEYLRNRGISTAPGLRFSESEPYFDAGKHQGDFPAMLGLVQSPQGKPLTWHVTYLHNGKKASFPAPKKVMKAAGGINGAAIRLFPAAEHMGIAEGIETAIAACEFSGIPTWAVMNTSGMQRFVVPETVTELTIFADNDANYAGQLAAYSLANRLCLGGLKVNVLVAPDPGTDWLDVLVTSENEQRSSSLSGTRA